MAVANTCECCGDSCTIFSDEFSTDELATNYTTDSGTWAVGGGSLSATSANARIRHDTVVPTGTTEIHCEVTITCATTSDAGELVFAYTDANNYWYASVMPGATEGSLKIFEVSGGVTTQRSGGRDVAGFLAGETVTLTVCYSGGLITVQTDITETQCYPVTLTVEGTYCGLKTGSASSSVTFDDFTVSRYKSGSYNTCPECSACNLCSVCEDDIGTWPSGWPASLTCTMSGACCATMNHSTTFNKLALAFPTYEQADTIKDCAGVSALVDGTLFCTSGIWKFDGDRRCHCNANQADSAFQATVTVLSCDPFHAQVTLPVCFRPSFPFQCCNGSVTFDFTE